MSDNKFGDTVDFMLSEKRDEAVDNNGFPKKVVMNKSGANFIGLENLNFMPMLAEIISFVEIIQIKYLNNLVEQDHRFIKKITKPMMGFKVFYSAKATIAGIETAHVIRKRQLSDENIPAYNTVHGISRVALPPRYEFPGFSKTLRQNHGMPYSKLLATTAWIFYV